MPSDKHGTGNVVVWGFFSTDKVGEKPRVQGVRN